MDKNIVILCPLFNDGESLNQLITALHNTLGSLPDHQFSLLIVNDGSTDPLVLENSTLFPIQILHLNRNIGHQKALAIGLAYIRDHIKCDKVLIMDTDGEDRAESAVELLYASDVNPSSVVFAHRRSRQATSQFMFFYNMYKISFRILTGRKISYGNFMVIPAGILNKIVFYSEIWSHLAGGILKSGINYTSVNTHRGNRYAGASKMNFSRLLVHGVGAISVFMEVIATRLLIFSFSLIAFSLLVILILAVIRTFTNEAIPGWTSTLMSSMLIVLLQSFLLSLVTLFLYFSADSQRKFVPAHHYKDYLGPVEKIS